MGNAQSDADNRDSVRDSSSIDDEQIDPALTDPDALYQLFAQGLSPDDILSSDAFRRMQNRIAGEQAGQAADQQQNDSILQDAPTIQSRAHLVRGSVRLVEVADPVSAQNPGAMRVLGAQRRFAVQFRYRATIPVTARVLIGATERLRPPKRDEAEVVTMVDGESYDAKVKPKDQNRSSEGNQAEQPSGAEATAAGAATAAAGPAPNPPTTEQHQAPPDPLDVSHPTRFFRATVASPPMRLPPGWDCRCTTSACLPLFEEDCRRMGGLRASPARAYWPLVVVLQPDLPAVPDDQTASEDAASDRPRKETAASSTLAPGSAAGSAAEAGGPAQGRASVAPISSKKEAMAGSTDRAGALPWGEPRLGLDARGGGRGGAGAGAVLSPLSSSGALVALPVEDASKQVEISYCSRIMGADELVGRGPASPRREAPAAVSSSSSAPGTATTAGAGSGSRARAGDDAGDGGSGDAASQPTDGDEGGGDGGQPPLKSSDEEGKKGSSFRAEISKQRFQFGRQSYELRDIYGLVDEEEDVDGEEEGKGDDGEDGRASDDEEVLPVASASGGGAGFDSDVAGAGAVSGEGVSAQQAAEIVAATKLRAAMQPVAGGNAAPEEDPAVAASLDAGGRTIAACVICLCQPRNTVALPCRHCCMCRGCADRMRAEQQRCPICRTQIALLLHIDALDEQEEESGDGGAASVPVVGSRAPGV